MHNTQTKVLFLHSFCSWNIVGIEQGDRFLLALNLYRSNFRHHPFFSAIFSRMAVQRGAVNFRLSLYCRRDIKWGISDLYSRNLTNKRDSLSMPMDSDAMLRVTTSKSENRGMTLHRGKFPCSLIKLPAICLRISRNFANMHIGCACEIVHKKFKCLYMLVLSIMHNFF